MIKLFVAGTPDFVSRIVREADSVQQVRVVSIANDPASAVDLLERRVRECHAVLFGFPDDITSILIETSFRYGAGFVPFVSVPDLQAGFKKWVAVRAYPVLNGKEIGSILDYFSGRPAVLQPQPEPFEVERDEDIETRVVSVKKRSATGAVGVPRKVASFFSFKGGVGKTVLTVSVAQSIAALTDLRVCIVDMDMSRNYGDVVKYLDYLGHRKGAIEHTLVTWRDFLFEQKAVWETVEAFLLKVRQKLYILPAVKSVTESGAITPELVAKTTDALRRHFDLVLFDLGNYLTDLVIVAMEASDEIFLVDTLDIPELDSLKEFLEATLPYVRVQKSQVNLVFNRIIPDQKFTVEDSAAFVGLPCVAAIPEDMELRKMLANTGRVPFLGGHDIPFTKELEKILFRLFPREIFGEEPRKESFFRGLLRKIGVAAG